MRVIYPPKTTMMSATSATSATSEADRATTREITKDVPPILRLPVEPRNVIYNYATAREDWPAHLQGESVSKDSLKDLTPQPQALLMPNKSDFGAPLLMYYPLSRVNKQLRAELSTFIHTTSMPVVARVRNLDFSHVIHFLSALEKGAQDAFEVRLDGTSERRLSFELQGPYTASCMGGLRQWIEYVQSSVEPGDRPGAELASLYKTVPTVFDENGGKLPRVSMTTLMDIIGYHGRCAPGSGRTEADKIMRACYYRFRVDYSFTLTSSRYENMMNAVQSKLVKRTLLGY
jgi:hypothetical protein